MFLAENPEFWFGWVERTSPSGVILPFHGVFTFHVVPWKTLCVARKQADQDSGYGCWLLIHWVVASSPVKKNSQEDQTSGLLSDDFTPISFQYKGDRGSGIKINLLFGKNWQTAKKNCVEKRSHLVVVNNLAELDFLSSFVKLSESYWIGLVEKEEGQWTWVDGTDFNSTEHHWDVGQPDDWKVRVNGEDCGQLHSRLTVGRRRLWNDADCTLSYPYICEGKPKSH
nr:C-type lectin domain family 10 member A [Osteobrama belangeri]